MSNVHDLRPKPAGLPSLQEAAERHERTSAEQRDPNPDLRRVERQADDHLAFFRGRLSDEQWMVMLTADVGQVARSVSGRVWCGERDPQLAASLEGLAAVAVAFARAVRDDVGDAA